MTAVSAPPTAPDWIGITPESLPVEAATAWASIPSAGAVVVFLGIVRDHAEGRDGVTALTYEAYESEAVRVMTEIAAAARARWSDLGRVALVHRTGRLALGEASVAVVVSSPHRDHAFDAARYCIDTLKETVPIWKQEHHAAGDDWGLGATAVRPVETSERV
ncbi:MAG: molybdenum cofactor biosynthesis protein MoaE [Acidimicrobiia bacterium]